MWILVLVNHGFWSDDFYPIGKVVKGYNDPTLCFEIVGSSTLPPDDEIAASYVSCQSCLA